MSATEYRHPGRTLDQRVEAFLGSEITSPVTRGLVIDLVAALAEQGEPEWEYRWAREDGEHAWPFGAGDSEDGDTLDEVKAAPAHDPEPEYFDGAHIERRTKEVPAGPWLSVEENTPTRTIRCPGCDCEPVGYAPHNGQGDCPPKGAGRTDGCRDCGCAAISDGHLHEDWTCGCRCHANRTIRHEEES